MSRLWTTKLEFKGKQGKVLSDGVYLDARPGTTTAIMGLAGCGKSVFLKMLTGYLTPSAGRVFLDKDDVHRAYKEVRGKVGYVPQAEIMIPELTVAASLDYRIRFSHRGLSAAQRREKCVEVCEQLGLTEVEQLLAKQIGAPEWTGIYPSGGERRRINTAHELLANPSVLLMDEPTSGLSAREADLLVRQMGEVARRRQIPVIMTIHQPSRETFERFDDLVVLALGGRPVYYGPCGLAAEYFSKTSNLPWDKVQNPADYILGAISVVEAGTWMANKFVAHLGDPSFDYLKRPGVAV